MDSSMDTSHNNPDTKPDIMQLNMAAGGAGGSVSSTTGAQFAAGLGGGGYSQSGAMRMGGSSGGYPSQASSTGGGLMPQGGYFDMNMLSGSGGMPPGMSGGAGGLGHPSQSPVHLQHSPAGGGSSASVSPSGFINMQSPTSTMGHPFHGGAGVGPGGPVPGGSAAAAMMQQQKHICAICGDRASGKHYGVYSCEGCKGFFKRTVRKDLQYACRDEKVCQIDKRQRNRCQYCRYMKCLTTGMKREAVQEERQRAKERGETEVESTTSANSDMPVEMILDAEMSVDNILESYVDSSGDPSGGLFQAAEKQIYALVEWVKHVPHFVELPLEDQVILMKTGWNELLIAGFAHMSTTVKDGIMLANGLSVYRNNSAAAGIGVVFDRVLTEIVSKIKEMGMDRTELGCLRAIVLFNPDCKGLGTVQAVESLREKVYATLEEYCKQQFPDEPGRFAKLLLRLPALRSIGLKCSEPLFFSKLINETTIEIFLQDVLESTSTN